MRASHLVVAVLLSGFGAQAIAPTAFADVPTSPGVGVIVDSPLAFGAWMGTVGSHGEFLRYELVAHHSSDGSLTHVVMTESGGPAGFAAIDDVLVDASALSYRQRTDSELWEISLDVELPTLGTVSIDYITPLGFVGLSSGGCFYEFTSPSFGLSGGWGNIYGTIDGREVTARDCQSWGVDVYGSYWALPISGG